jgi:ABC-type transport system involved in multi-copper enzyme maturation permease subunit
MIWLTWRQFRVQAVTATAALVVLAGYLILLGLDMRDSYKANVDCTGCTPTAAKNIFENNYYSLLLLTGLLLVLVPAVIGAFWGAPLIARELETGTHRLVWNQTVTRARWLTIKLCFVMLAGVAFTGVFSALLTWAASPYDTLFDGRFHPLFFSARNIVPLGYAAFAVVLGVTVGLIVRRTVLAMAITLGLVVGLQLLVPAVIRPHLQPAITEQVPFTMAAGGGIGIGENGVRTQSYSVPGAWVFNSDNRLFDPAGNPATQATLKDCNSGEREQMEACIDSKNLHLTITYQPADRYWTFQWVELAMYLLLAGLLAGYAFWRLPRGLS